MRFNIFYFRNIPDFLQKRDKEGKKEERKGGNEAIEKTYQSSGNRKKIDPTIL